MLTTDCASDRLPEDASAKTRWPGSYEHVQLAEGRDVVETGIGPRVGDHHETVANQDAAAIGHGEWRSPNAKRTRYSEDATALRQSPGSS